MISFQVHVPEELVKEYYDRFENITQPHKRPLLEDLRDGIYLVLELVSADPELLHDEEFQEDLTRAAAIKAALMQRNCLYDD